MDAGAPFVTGESAPGRSVTEWTIDELAAETGTPSRTIREYQRLGLVPSPRREGRVGLYGPAHRARLAVIGRLQQRGYSLAAIGDLMGSWEQGRGLGSVLGVNADPAVLDEAPTELSKGQLEQVVPALADRLLFDAARDSGLVQPVRHDTVVVRSLALVELVGLAIESGIPPRAAIEVAGRIRSAAADAASSAVEEFAEHLWPRRGELDLVRILSRFRLLLAQAAASLMIHELGADLTRRAELDQAGGLRALIDRVAIGQIRTMRVTDGDEEDAAI
jgi:DNA-binding transcriptional MerR regulator